jgi:hypothetical protein
MKFESLTLIFSIKKKLQLLLNSYNISKKKIGDQNKNLDVNNISHFLNNKLEFRKSEVLAQ